MRTLVEQIAMCVATIEIGQKKNLYRAACCEFTAFLPLCSEP